MAALDDVKAALRVSGTDHDALLTRLIAAGLAAYNNYVGGNPLSTVDAMPDDAFVGLVAFVRGNFDADPSEFDEYRAAAEREWFPYRTDMGV